MFAVHIVSTTNHKTERQVRIKATDPLLVQEEQFQLNGTPGANGNLVFYAYIPERVILFTDFLGFFLYNGFDCTVVSLSPGKTVNKNGYYGI
jgi:hypothetical protein